MFSFGVRVALGGGYYRPSHRTVRKSGGLGKLRLYMGQSDFTPYVPDRDPSEMNGPQMWNGWEEALIPGYSTKGLNGRGVEDARGFEFSGRIRYH